MRPISAIFLLGLWAFSACVPPVSENGPDHANAVASQVQLLLTSSPIALTPTEANFSPFTLTPKATAKPSATSTPGLEPATQTSAPFITATVSPSPSPNPNDPRKLYGSPSWAESFDEENKSFFQFENEHTRIKYEPGNLSLTAITAEGWQGWSLAFPKLKNYYLEGTFQVQDCANLDRYGFVLRAPDFNQGYFFGISCDGRYNFRIYTEKNDLISWTRSDAIKTGSNQSNTVGVQVKGNTFTLYVNGKKLQEVNDPTFSKEGFFGVFIAAFNTPGFTVKLDQISYWKLP